MLWKMYNNAESMRASSAKRLRMTILPTVMKNCGQKMRGKARRLGVTPTPGIEKLISMRLPVHPGVSSKWLVELPENNFDCISNYNFVLPISDSYTYILRAIYLLMRRLISNHAGARRKLST